VESDNLSGGFYSTCSKQRTGEVLEGDGQMHGGYYNAIQKKRQQLDVRSKWPPLCNYVRTPNHRMVRYSHPNPISTTCSRYRDPYLIGGPFCRAKPARNECPRCVLGGSKNRPALDTAIKPTFCNLKMGRRSQPKQEACNFFRTPGRPLKPQPRPPKSRLIAELFLPG
jgi:hypothetical protein